MSDIKTTDPLDGEEWICASCGIPEPPIFMCSEGWWCEDCYRREAGVPAEVSSDDLHNAVSGDALGFNEALRQSIYGELEDE